MSATPNLLLAHLLASQSQKDVTVNQALDGLDQAVAGTTSLDVSAGGTFTLTSAQWANLRLLLTGTPSAGVTIRLPSNRKGYIVDNHCGQTATVGYTSGTTVNVATATMAWIYFDGTNALLLNMAGSTSGGPYDMGMYLSGTYTNGQTIGEYIFPRTVNFPASMTGSYAQADAASTGTVSCTVSKNGTSIGTIQFAVSTSATFVSFSATTFNAGDVLKLTAPGTADTTLAGVRVTLTGTR